MSVEIIAVASNGNHLFRVDGKVMSWEEVYAVAKAEEREACAKVAEDDSLLEYGPTCTASTIANAIRARGK